MDVARTITVRDLVVALDREFPIAWADSWDRVGLVAGDHDAPVRSVLVTLDADRAAVHRAVAGGYDVLLTHHPAALEVSLPLIVGGKDAVLVDAMAAHVALVSFHTNLDRAPAGAEALPKLLGLHIVEPLEASEEPVAVVTTFAPFDAADGVRDALTAAGAGRVGLYSGCSFSGAGTGRYVAHEGSAPKIGGRGAYAGEEVRIEATCPPAIAGAVLSAVRDVHPYEEPTITVVTGELSRGAARLGRLCELEEPESLSVFAARCASVLSVDARVWGDPGRAVRRVAVGNGSVRSLIGRAIAMDADALLGGEVRYHDARAALDAGLAVIEAGHDATEWPLVHVLARAAREALGDRASVTEEEPAVGWWTTERR
ncbi:MAG: Nif3-like dinuclear metal center hexameric protein [Coriobacteriia bacterium]|nr:Nif3-like dinuclear metal center hexameric protein [Coriobacteriia bacterium]